MLICINMVGSLRFIWLTDAGDGRFSVVLLAILSSKQSGADRRDPLGKIRRSSPPAEA